jgi:hypothetical protein
MLASEHLQGRLSILPAFTNPDGSSNMNTVVAIFIIPLAVQWWRASGIPVRSRAVAVRRQPHARGQGWKARCWATLSSTPLIMLLRPWPWILVALCSLIIFPLDSSKEKEAATAALASPELKALVEQWDPTDPTSMDEATWKQIETLKNPGKGPDRRQRAFPILNTASSVTIWLIRRC